MMNNNLLVIEKIYSVSIEKVWAAITDVEQLRQWYFNLEEFKPEVGFEFKFSGQGHKGNQYMHICKITEVIPFKKLQYSWQYENYQGYSLVTFDLQEENNYTHLTLTHAGLESFPENNPDFAKESFQGGWTELITLLLDQHLKKQTTIRQ